MHQAMNRQYGLQTDVYQNERYFGITVSAQFFILLFHFHEVHGAFLSDYFWYYVRDLKQIWKCAKFLTKTQHFKSVKEYRDFNSFSGFYSILHHSAFRAFCKSMKLVIVQSNIDFMETTILQLEKWLLCMPGERNLGLGDVLFSLLTGLCQIQDLWVGVQKG